VRLTKVTLNDYFERVGLTIRDRALLEMALVHRSFVHEQWERPIQSNERLEFLGDSVLNYLTARFLYETFPTKGEGTLTALRAALVRTSTLARWAHELDLGAELKLGKGEEQSGGRTRTPLLADAFEALVAAIFLDSGAESADRFLRPLLEREVAQIDANGLVLDEKSRLQERVQGERNETPRYRTVRAEGPDHERRFTIEVWAGSTCLGVGEGPSKQAAAQAAARAALAFLDEPEAPVDE
jgi:ribonuclease-3